MKRLFKASLLVLLGITIIISCSKKDDPAPATSIIGTWKLVSVTNSNCTDPADNGTETCTTDCYTVTFTETTITYAINGASVSANYSVSGNTITVTPPGSSSSFTSSFSVTSTTLTITETSDVSGCEEVYLHNRQ